ncbi:MAG TPA: M48 family metalloprotease [Woeseiaceae bacterium]|nr:M48 family metalloprotease [Woeseiaceae bacterium]|tara:strand:- start:4094 stop:5566 length:1473 start_codon:yes stop_codon:yes gene_type:complete
MYLRKFFIFIAQSIFILNLWIAVASSQDLNLPDIGNPADAVLSKSDEAQIGSSIMRQIRSSGAVIEDPQINEYLNEIGHRVASHINDSETSFTFFVIDDSSLNAFALPGGYIGVHSGLIESTRSEDELAGVLAHEIAHVTQRHIARAMAASQRQSLLSTAIMLGAVIAGATGAGSDAVQGAMAVAQGTQAQQQINFTRDNEYEADRIGISAMASAGFDPRGMASFFEVMSGTNTLGSMRIPEFLQTHPVSSSRIAEAKNRARLFTKKDTEDTRNYGISRARLIVSNQRSPEDAINFYTQKDFKYLNDAEKYGLALSYQSAGELDESKLIFQSLLNDNKEVIAYHIALADVLFSLEEINASREIYENAMKFFPRNTSLVIHYANALLKLNEAKLAHDILLDLLNNVPPTPEQVRLIAKAAIESNNPAEANYYMAEYRFMIGDLVGGITFLRRALNVPNLNEIQRIRFEARIDFVREFMTEEQLQQLRRASG